MLPVLFYDISRQLGTMKTTALILVFVLTIVSVNALKCYQCSEPGQCTADKKGESKKCENEKDDVCSLSKGKSKLKNACLVFKVKNILRTSSFTIKISGLALTTN